MKSKRKPLTAIQKSAKDEQCTVIMHGCNPFDTTTTVLAHNTEPVPNSPRRCDARAAYACVHCHDKLDGKERYNWEPWERAALWGRAIAKTHVKLMEKGLMDVDGIERQLPKQLPRRW